MAGWIKLCRDINSHWIWSDANYLHAWITILINVNYEDKATLIGGELLECKRGQSLLSVGSWIKEFRTKKGKNYWTPQRVKTFFNLLQKDEMILLEGLRKTTRLTVCNYGYYQDLQLTNNSQITNKQLTDNSQITTTKERKEIKKERNKEYKNILLSEIKISDDILFEKIYFETAIGFRDLIRQNLIELNASTKNIDSTKGSAIDEIRLIIESDGFTIEDCRQVYKFLQKDIFWKKNILSIKKLREKFNKLLIEAKNGDSKIQSGNTSYRKNTAGANAEDKRRSVDRLADMAETILQNLAPRNVQ